MRVGAHVSVGGDYRKMRDYALSVGCECAQIFAKNAKQYKFAAPTAQRLSQMAEVKLENPELGVYSHTAYLINLSGVDDEIRAKSTEAFAGELAIAAMLGLCGVNTHVGNDKQHDPQAAALRAAESICAAHDRADDILAGWCLEDGLTPTGPMDAESGLPVVPTVILEDAAGAGNQFGCTVEEMAAIIGSVEQIGFSRGSVSLDATESGGGIGICIDTCHAWAQGYDVSTADGWDSLAGQIDDSIGIGRLRLIHSNDSKFGRGEHKDRHEWVGNGCIGREGFSHMMKMPQLSHVDVVLEIPGEIPEKDEINIALLKEMRG